MKKFVKPTIEEIREYAKEVFPQLDCERFIDYYTMVGWTVGRNRPMKDWKAAVRLWKRNYETRFGTIEKSKESSENWRQKYEEGKN